MGEHLVNLLEIYGIAALIILGAGAPLAGVVFFAVWLGFDGDRMRAGS